MTRKEKKELALKIKAEIEARKPKEPLTPEQEEKLRWEAMEKNNLRRRQRDKARNRRNRDDMLGKKYIPKGWDFEKW